MKRVFSLILVLGTLAACAPDYTSYVNPNIGTVHSRWFVYTPAAVPFGMAKLGPSTNGTYGNASGWEAVGYDDTHTSIDGFPCFHEFQVGGLALMPVSGEPLTVPGRLEDPSAGSGTLALDSKSDESLPPKPKALQSTCFSVFFSGFATGTMPSVMYESFTTVLAKGETDTNTYNMYCYPSNHQASHPDSHTPLSTVKASSKVEDYWTSRCTRAAILAEIGGVEKWYPITIPLYRYTGGYWYEISAVNLQTSGSDSPDVESTEVNITFSLTVRDWTGTVISENI